MWTIFKWACNDFFAVKMAWHPGTTQLTLKSRCTARMWICIWCDLENGASQYLQIHFLKFRWLTLMCSSNRVLFLKVFPHSVSSSNRSSQRCLKPVWITMCSFSEEICFEQIWQVFRTFFACLHFRCSINRLLLKKAGIEKLH